MASEKCADLATPISAQDHIQGLPTAPVILVEYGDYECPDCLNAWPVIQEVLKQSEGRVAFVFRHFPQNSIHPHASAAAQAAEAAGAQGKFWEMHDQLFEHQAQLATLDLTHLALRLGLEVYRFDAALETEAHLRRIREDSLGGRSSGVTGTPTLFINGCRYRGPIDVKSILAAM